MRLGNCLLRFCSLHRFSHFRSFGNYRLGKLSLLLGSRLRLGNYLLRFCSLHRFSHFRLLGNYRLGKLSLFLGCRMRLGNCLLRFCSLHRFSRFRPLGGYRLCFYLRQQQHQRLDLGNTLGSLFRCAVRFIGLLGSAFGRQINAVVRSKLGDIAYSLFFGDRFCLWFVLLLGQGSLLLLCHRLISRLFRQFRLSRLGIPLLSSFLSALFCFFPLGELVPAVFFAAAGLVTE